MPSKGSILLAFVLCLACLSCVSSLSDSEEVTLGQIYDSFPTLRALPYSALVNAKDFRGLPWTKNFTSLCSGGPKWAFYGIHCDVNGNIDGVLLYDSFCAT